jgi:hypothetical protein
MNLTKKELLRQVKKFLQDPDRGISHMMFAELCGIDMWFMRQVFLDEERPLSETVQIRVNKGYDAWKKGLVKTMQRKDRSRYVDYRTKAEPLLAPSMGLKLVGGELKLRVGMVNRRDYSQRDLNGD